MIPGWLPTPIVDPRTSGTLAYAGSDAVLWLARMVVGEAGERSTEAQARALVSTIVRRWFQVDALTGRARDLVGMVRAYSTPLQEARRGEAGGRPARVQDLRWEEIPPSIQSVVTRTLRGELALSAPAAVHWAAPSLYAPHGLDSSSLAARARTAPAAVIAREGARGNVGALYVAIPGAPAADNVFSSTIASRSLPDPVLGRSSAGQGTATGGALAALVAVAVWALSKWVWL